MTSVHLEITILPANVFRIIIDTAQQKIATKNTFVMLVIIYMSKLD